MAKIRGFEIVAKYENKQLKRPKRATANSAGYDLAAAKDITIPSIWNVLKEDEIAFENKDYLTSILVPTGVKAYMPDDEFLMLVNRSSNPLKNNLSLPNGVGIIDADYYNNEENEGEIFVQLINYGLEDYTIEKGDRIAQGIFMSYEKIDDEGADLGARTGGFGSSGRN